ncbi:hypothetical protein HDV04_005949 [Boothiomyces sp. JEL0838]|nr:hypothetical protein HDV04_005949 [Boothiomyces sp. JEL0838]
MTASDPDTLPDLSTLKITKDQDEYVQIATQFTEPNDEMDSVTLERTKKRISQAGVRHSSYLPAMQPLSEKPETIKEKDEMPAFLNMFSCIFPCLAASNIVTRATAVPLAKLSLSRPSALSPSSEMKPFLPPQKPEHYGKKLLVLDLDETLIHTSFKPLPKADHIIHLEMNNVDYQVNVLVRPGCKEFLQAVSKVFELVVFTASIPLYANPVIDFIDTNKVITHRLFREHCIHHKGNYVKDLSLLGRELKDVIIVDNSPICYMFHPANAIPITGWFDNPNDRELYELLPFLEDLKSIEDVALWTVTRGHLNEYHQAKNNASESQFVDSLDLNSLSLDDKEPQKTVINDFSDNVELDSIPIVESVKPRKTLTHNDFTSRHSMKKAAMDLDEPIPPGMDFRKQVEKEIEQVIVSVKKEKDSIFSCFTGCFGGTETLNRANTMPSIVNRSETVMSISGMSNILPPQEDKHKGKKLLVLDLDETLVHSSFKPVASPDFTLQLDIGTKIVGLNVSVRPGLDLFLQTLAQYYEIAVFTASVALDLNLLGRNLKDVVIIDNLYTCYLFHPSNAIPITSWYDDRQDTELFTLIPFLEALRDVDDVTTVLDQRTID